MTYPLGAVNQLCALQTCSTLSLNDYVIITRIFKACLKKVEFMMVQGKIDTLLFKKVYKIDIKCPAKHENQLSYYRHIG